jgi:hypothetical protein
MLKTKNLVTSITDVPNNWIYEYYLGLSEKLGGQDVNLKSMFSGADTKPSFFIFYSNADNKYYWKDFSAGKSGDAIELVRELKGFQHRYLATALIVNDFNTYVLSNDVVMPSMLESRKRYHVVGHKLRAWNVDDKNYWTQFRIGSNMLMHYNVKPLHSFKLRRDDQPIDITVRNKYIYGYFHGNTLFKIYQPLSPDYKFFKVSDYIQGSDQLSMKKPYLVICSSLKDLMALHTLGFSNMEAIAPDSENTSIPEEAIQLYKQSYTGICTLFDNDAAGVTAMDNYLEQYNIPFVHFKYEKDIADCVKVHGVENTRVLLQPLLSKVLKESTKLLHPCDLLQ